MKKNRKQSIKSLVLLSSVLLSVMFMVGCGNTRLAEDGESRRAEDDEINEGTEENTNTEVTEDKVDTSDEADWLTYENEEYGYSFEYPEEWHINFNSNNNVFLSDSVDVVNLKTKGEGNYELLPNTFIEGAITVKENIVSETINDEEALKIEDGRDAPPLLDETYSVINYLPSLRSFRKVNKGEKTAFGDIRENTTINIEYTYRDNDNLIYFWFSIVNNESEETIKLIDNITHTFRLID